jgi:hypothetical protein
MLAAKNSFGRPYTLFAKLGAGTLFDDRGVSLFGDLAHLTSAAKCDLPVLVGGNICDIWQRSFNQNPHVVYLFRFLKFTDVFLVGIFSTILLFCLIVWVSWKFKIQSFIWVLFLASPPFVLAIDRGNEVITLLLIVLAFFVLTVSEKFIWFTSMLLSVATFFKFWPLLLLISLSFYSVKFRKFFLASSILMGGYWIFHLNTLKEISRDFMVV